jgi:hypothetical protein
VSSTLQERADDRSGEAVSSPAQLVTGDAVLEHGVLATASLVTSAASWNTSVLVNASLVMVGGVLATAELRCCGWEWR